MKRWLVALVVIAIAACHHATTTQKTTTGTIQRGIASWYGEAQMTASGERFDPRAMTAAHRTLPLGSRVRVTNTRNGRSVIVRINDRGPYGKGRVIDLSRAAAAQLGMIDAGLAPVTIEVLSR